MKNFYILLVILLSFVGQVFAQQDCCDGQPIGGGAFTIPSNSGNGGNDPVASCSCLGTGEHDSYWFTFTCTVSGSFEMMITPLGLAADFDFALYANECPCGGGTIVTSCDYTGPITPPGPFVPTGISSSPAATFGVPGATEFQPTVTLTAGTTYYLIADNITTNGAGFDIEFAGTAAFGPPASGSQPGPSPISGYLTACPGANVDYSVPFNPQFTNYNWVINPPTASVNSNGTNMTNISYTAPGSYQVCVDAKVGCITTQQTCINVEVEEIVTQPINDVICTGGFYNGPDGVTYTDPGSYTMAFQSWQGCDSSVLLNLSPVPLSNVILNKEICDGDCYTFGTQTVCISGIYQEVLINQFGCDSIITLSLLVSPNEAIITGDNTISCSTGSTILSGGESLGGSNMTFTWTNQQGQVIGTAPDIAVTAAGTYTLTTSSNVSGGMCTDQASVDVTATAAPNVSATGGAISCVTPAVIISGNSTTSGVTYGWTGPGGFTSTQQNPSVSVIGTYVLTVTSPNGCTATTSANVTGNSSLPNAAATGGTVDCDTPTLNLEGSSSTPNVTWAWTGPGGFTSTSQNPANVSAAGTYTLTVTAPNGCSAQASALVSNDNAAPNAVASGGGTLNCSSPSLSIQGTSSTVGAIYGWTGPGGFTSAVQNPSVTVAGIYLLTVTGPNGCTASDDVEVLANVGTPNVSATGGTLDCESPSLVLDGGSTTAGVGFAWTGPNGFTSTSEDPSISISGPYVLTVTAANGCTATASTVVDQDIAVPNAAATGGILTCTSGSVDLAGNSTTPGAVYGWTGPGGYTSTSQNPTVTTAGTYVLTVTSDNGCTASSSAVVQQDSGLPDVFASASGPLDCNISSVTLDGGSATSGVSLVWSGPGGFTSTETNPVVTVPGAYTLTATAVNNCTAQALATVVLDDQTPDIHALGGTLTCTETSVTLDGESNTVGASFEWSTLPGGTVVGTSPDADVSQAGTYLLTVTGTNGCTATATADVAANADAPDISATGGNLDCSVTETTLDGGSATTGVSFAWSGPNGFSAGQADTLASEAGTYILVVTSPNGCSATSQVVVSSDTQAPGAQADGGILSCSASSIQLAGSSTYTASSWSWTGPGGFTSTEQNPDVTLPGSYSLTVTAPNGCTSSDNAIVAQDANAPVASALGDTLTCAQTSVQLLGGSSIPGVTYVWAGPGGFNSNQQNPTVSNQGTYVLTITAGNGCVGVANAIVALDNAAPNVTATGGTLTCTATGISLIGNSTTANVTYEWADPSGTITTTQNPTVSVAGTYVLTVTAANGCTSTASAVVNNNSDAPNISATAPNIDCNNLNIVLNGGSTSTNVTYIWTGPGGFTSNQSDPTTTEPGTYLLTVTATNGCSATASVDVAENIAAPNVTAAGGNITCADPTLPLQGGSSTTGVTWLWAGPNGFTSTQQNPTVTQGGTYVLTVTGTNGCTSTASAQVTADAGFPVASVTGGTITCTTTSLQLGGTSTVVDVAWNWTGPGGYTSTEQNPTISQPGTYVLTVTTTAGCSSTASTNVLSDTTPPTAEIASADQLDCVTPNTLLDGSSSSSGTGFEFVWATSTGNFASGENTLSPTVDAAGVYTLTITGPNGCVATASMEVLLSDATPSDAVLTINPPACFGETNGSIFVNEVVGGTPPYQYSLNGQPLGAGNSFTNLAPNTYSLTVSDATGCTWQTDVVLDDPAEVTVALDADLEATQLLLGDSVELQATTLSSATQLASVIWTPVGIDVNCPGCLNLTVAPITGTTYTITIADENGCEASDEVTVLVNPGRTVYVPNAFSPNGDGFNDLLTIFGSRNVTNVKSFLVFSRWGEAVWQGFNFQPNNPGYGWDGNYRGKELNPEVFTWVAEVEFVDGKILIYKGDVNLMR